MYGQYCISVNNSKMKGLVPGIPMIESKNNFNTAATGILIIASIFSGCAIVPTRNTLTLNKTIELDERAIEKLNVGVRLEWIR